MVVSQFKVLKGSIATLALLPLAAIGFMVSASSAKAAALTGSFHFNGGFSVPAGASSLVEFTQDSLKFSPQPITPIILSSQTGSFTAFNSANIADEIIFNPSLSTTVPLFDFGNLPANGVVMPGDDTSSLIDGVNTFTLTSASYELLQLGANVAINVGLNGFFTSSTGEETQGSGIFTFQALNTTVDDLNTLLTSGASTGYLSFSGGVFTTTVPEPATLTGLGLVGAAIGISRRRRNKKLAAHRYSR
ncbi:PEP-CTERM putative exosortase interaction domain-containing protein [Nostoc sp. PCC 7524]|uniref:PEP-CTERM sorting domain-containing protein n=1 Tax=Nostoc sp. (strain ATCC 29411 / PCC 7524) TaxID=28072 RepID=UPI00029F491D|nr:PEP-CTERM sorting domain-containing protein [Nostoc sp. PCC 7524]AFY50604.1 PEP-CTERM putative exosortase interaction domain-containing protein [Nostoc sp. PCC 7524]